jgi:hypothetical protein
MASVAGAAAEHEPDLFAVDDVAALPVAEIRRTLERAHFARIRGLVAPAEIDAVMARIAARFSHRDDQPSAGNPPDFFRRNFQKLRVGVLAGRPEVARLLRTFYNPLSDADVFGMHALFRRLAGVRNALLGLPPGFACDAEQDGLFTSARIHQYPVGGGFMSPHADDGASPAARARGMEFVQAFLVMSTRGVDYERGGAYVEHAGTRIDLEARCRAGDVVVYDGATRHGVAEIDPHRPLDMERFGGRVVAFATLWSSR